MFIALATGSALRQSFAPETPPAPAAWSAQAVTVHTAPMPGPPAVLDKAASTVSLPSTPPNKTNNKPIRRAWVTKERPLSWNRLSAHSVLTPAPLSFTPIGSTPGGARSRAPAAMASDRDILTEICVTRR